MGRSLSWKARGRGVRSGLVVVLGAVSACQQGPPAGEPVQGYQEPSVSQQQGWTLIENEDPVERLLVYDDPPEDGVQLLFLAGRAASPSALASARDLLDFHLAPVRPGDPLLWVHDEQGGDRVPVGSALRPANVFLGQLVNTGWATRRAEGLIVFASAVRPELVAFDPGGDTLWVSRWQPVAAVDAPTFQAIDGSAVPVFSVLQFGVVAAEFEAAESGAPELGAPESGAGAVADGGELFYVLAALEPEVGPDHVLVFDIEGRLLRAGRVPQGSAIFADARGRVYVASEEEGRRRTGDPHRTPFPTFDLPTLGRPTERTVLEEYRGKVVVVNFWASWCGPCRREMPLLDTFSRTLDRERAVVVGLNEDVAPDAGLAFIAELGGISYESGTGGGRLRRQYSYRGLPYTIVLDPDLRVVKSFYGFGSSIDPIIRAVRKELDG